ncbi:hypothetical protein AVEN_208855-1 [Araneus ventricosus]|uniref:Uncharacterized protein n=1 Tax=Araneus ventricosus TaxID=182803 RepID=A0A4Y2KN94_ARAVE|nr:hypothetical protein AVEN_208855-1 [Araneus ventricosus]
MRSRKQTERRQLLMESSLACRRGMEGISSKAEGIEEGKLERSKYPWEPRDWDTRTHLKKQDGAPPYWKRVNSSTVRFLIVGLAVPEQSNVSLAPLGHRTL